MNDKHKDFQPHKAKKTIKDLMSRMFTMIIKSSFRLNMFELRIFSTHISFVKVFTTFLIG